MMIGKKDAAAIRAACIDVEADTRPLVESLSDEDVVRMWRDTGGHDLDVLIPVLENVRDNAEGPVLVHCVTQKGKGYAPAEASADKYHGVAKFVLNPFDYRM